MYRVAVVTDGGISLLHPHKQTPLTKVGVFYHNADVGV